MADFIIIAILLFCIGFAVFQIYKKKKDGAGCCHCPNSSSCGGQCSNKR